MYVVTDHKYFVLFLILTFFYMKQYINFNSDQSEQLSCYQSADQAQSKVSRVSHNI